MLAYGRTLCALWDVLGKVRDGRTRPVIPASRAVQGVFILWLTRLGSLNALEQTHSGRGWHRLLGGALPSADTVGRVFSSLDLEAIRQIHRALYTRLKRRKALEPPPHGLVALVLDGHESHATYERHCTGCLSRQIPCKDAEGGTRTQFYHRHVAAILVVKDLNLFLDLEPIRPGEDEIAAALRLLDRLLVHYPRAFDVGLAERGAPLEPRCLARPRLRLGLRSEARLGRWALCTLGLLQRGHRAGQVRAGRAEE